MKTELNEQEVAMMEVVKNKWIDLAFNKCQLGIDKEKFETGITWLYDKFLNLPKPQVVYCNSLIDAAIKITLVKDYGKELSDFNPQLIQDYEEGKLDKEFYEKAKENLSLKSTYVGWSNFGWVSFYDYFTNIEVINHEDFNEYKKLIESNVFECFEFEKAVFAVKPPMEIIYNENLLPHNIEGHSIQFIDGSKFYHVNGFAISKELFDSLYNKTYTVENFLSESNEEIKSAVISFIQARDGETGVYDFLKENLEEVDTYVDVKDESLMVGTTNSTNIGVYTLFKGEINDIEIAYVRCYCPSTDRMFFLGVQPHHTNAKDAIASLYQIPVVLKDKIKTISRQGEKFSTTFDEQTTIDIKNGKYSDKELREYTSISGDEYFNLMTYEY